MKNFLIAFGVFFIWSVFGLWVFSLLQPVSYAAVLDNNATNSVSIDTPLKEIISDSDIENNKLDTKNSVKQQSSPIDIEDKKISGMNAIDKNGTIIFNFEESIVFKKNTTTLLFPPSISIITNKIKNYLQNNPDQELHISSIYSPMETVLSPNLGIQRANEVSKQLINSGVSEEKIVLKSVIKDIAFSEEGTFNNGISFLFKPLDTTRIKEMFPKTKIVYPEYSGTNILVNNNLKALLNEVSSYFNINPTKSIEVVGHTDNIGNSHDNYSSGLNDAKQVREYLIVNGNFSRTTIKASSKGEAEPIDDNYTKRGRIANKRIEVIFN